MTPTHPESPPAASGCPLCAPSDEADVLWRDQTCRVVWVDDARFPGFCRVVLNAHVSEMTDLPHSARHRLMAVVFAAEEAVREVAGPDKVNLASLGNVVPHLHWHVIPRFRDDACFPDAIWAPPRRTGLRRERSGLRTRLERALRMRLGMPTAGME